MTRIFDSGAEWGDTLDFDTVAGTAVASAAQKYTGSYSYLLPGNGANLGKNFSALSELYFRARVLITAISTERDIIIIRNSTTTLAKVAYDPSVSLLKLYISTNLVATAGESWPVSTWGRLELRYKIDNTVGVFTLLHDGAEVVTFTGDTQPGAATTADNILLQGATSMSIYYDDIALNDTAGLADNSYPGNGRCLLIVGDADGDSSQWTNSAGTSVNNYDYTNNIPPNPAVYVQDSVVGHQDLYNLAASGLLNATIRRTRVSGRGLDTVGGNSIILNLKATTLHASGALPLTTSLARVAGPDYTTNPDTGLAWTISDLDAVQVGPEVA